MRTAATRAKKIATKNIGVGPVCVCGRHPEAPPSDNSDAIHPSNFRPRRYRTTSPERVNDHARDGVLGVCTMAVMIKSDRINFRLGPDLRAALQAYSRRYERSESDVIREAVWLLLESKGYRRTQKKGGKKR